MTYVKSITTLSAALALLLAGSAYAEPREGRFPINLEEVATRQAQHFDAIDQDNDERVSLAEFEQAPRPKHARRHQRGQRMHRRGGPGRRAHHGEGRKEQRQALRAATQAEVFKLLDSNNDGVLSTAEHAAADRETRQLARKRAVFAQLDSNQDGQLEAAEMPSRLARLQAADSDGDGQITRDEMRAARQHKSG